MEDHDERDLRRELAKLERGPGKRYPRKLRERVTAWARREMSAGCSFRRLIRRLELHPTTLRAWLEDAAVSGAVVPVEIVDAAAESSTARLVAVSPRGLRVEGLTLDEAATLLARFG